MEVILLFWFGFFTFQFAKKKLLFTRPAGITSLTPSAGTTGNNSVDEQRISVF